MLFGFPIPRINAAKYPWSDPALLMMFVLQTVAEEVLRVAGMKVER